MTEFVNEQVSNGQSAQRDDARSDNPAAASRANAVILAPGADNVVTLPAGSAIDSIVADGRDLVITLADGRVFVIPGAVADIPLLVVDGTPIPPANVAALLIGNEPEPAADGVQSSGGNFYTDPGDIQAAFDLGNLLPYTELLFTRQPEDEVIPSEPDQDPIIDIEVDDSGVSVINAVDAVDEAGLPARGDEPEGTDEPLDSESTYGFINFDSPDGTESVTINGVEVTEVGQTFETDLGILTITSIEPGRIGYSYLLTDNALGAEADFFEVTITDPDGDMATATLRINIVDDAPIAVEDFGDVEAGTFGPIEGNVVETNDEPGADGFPVEGAVVGVAAGDTGADVSGSLGDLIVGEYGTLTLNADGSYSYTRDYNTPGGVEDVFTYTIEDQDGSKSTTTLTIRIGDVDNSVAAPDTGDGTIVSEDGLPARGDEPEGTQEPTDSETTTGTITFNSPDGVGSVTIGGVTVTPGSLPQTIVSDATGTLVVTEYTYDPVTGDGTITYEYTLGDNTSGDGNTAEFEVVVTDLDGDKAEDTLVITILDDAPLAVDDSASQTVENADVIIDVYPNDIPGADGVVRSSVEEIPGTLSGTGSLQNNGDGTFTYTPGPGEEGQVTFDYKITDSDGSESIAKVTITLLEDSEPLISVEGDNDASEAGLPARGDEPEGSDESSDSETATGVISINTGGDTIGSLVINGQDVTGGGTVTTAKGVLTITVTDGAYSYSYTLTDNSLTHPDSDSFTLVVTDSDGDSADTSLVIAILNDLPSAEDDTGSVPAGEYGPIGGNVMTNDTQGADGATVTAYTGFGGSGVTGETIDGEWGTLTIDAQGNYSYTRNPGTPGGETDTFQYTITDGDGDPADAYLVISIGNSTTTLDLPTDGEAGTQVLEEGLNGPPAGSQAGGDGEFTSGTFTYTAPDGPATVTIDGVAVTFVGQTFPGDHGTLTIDAIAAGSISYTYELTAATNGDNTSDSFDVVVSDVDSDSTPGTLVIGIVDDVPTALADTDSVTDNGPLTADGNVLTGTGGADANATDGVADTQGADGATVTGVALGNVGGDVSDPLSLGAPIVGKYGTLTLNGDGSYTYVLDDTNPTVIGLDGTESLADEYFTYTITDGDTDTSTTKLQIIVNGANDPVVINGLEIDFPGYDIKVREENLADGSNPNASELVRVGDFTIDSPDGLATLEVAGITIFGDGVTYPVAIPAQYGELQITGVTPVFDAEGDVISATVTFQYTFSENTLDHPAPDPLVGSDQNHLDEQFEVKATDTDGSVGIDFLDVAIKDDTPIALKNEKTVEEGGLVGGNVLSDNDGFGVDHPGADGYAADGAVREIISVATNETLTLENGDFDADGNYMLETPYGFLTINLDGSYTYESKPNSVNQDALDVFKYVIEDGDGDRSFNYLQINIDNVSGDVSDNDINVNEAGLAAGSDFGSNSHIDATGQITVTNATGPFTYTLTGANSDGDGTYGTLVLNADGSYTYTLDTPFTDAVDENGRNVVNGAEGFGYEVRDGANNLIGTGTIQINIADDIPTAISNPVDGPTPGQDVNAAFILDFSGSIHNDELDTMLVAVKDAVERIYDNADSNEITITLIGFSATALDLGTYSTFAEASAAIDGLNPEEGGTRPYNHGLTDFTAAVEATIAPGGFVPIPGANNQVFFLSDGNPNEQLGSGGNALADATSTAWAQFIADNNINVSAIGIGNNISTGSLEDVDLDGDANVLLADDFDDLIDTLIDVVSPQGGSIQIPNSGSEVFTRLINDPDGDTTGNDFIGADGFGSLIFTGSSDGAVLQDNDSMAVTVDGETVYLFGFGTDTLVATTDLTNSDASARVFEVTFDEGTGYGADATYSIEFFQTLDDGSGFTFDNFSSAPAGQNRWIGLDADGGAINASQNDSEDLLITGLNGGSINTSSSDIGSNNQWIDENEGIRLDYVIDVAGGGAEKTNQGYTHEGHYAVRNSSFAVLQTKSGNAAVTISLFFDTDTGNLKVLDGTPVDLDLSSIVVTNSGGTDVTGSVTITDNGDGTATVSDLLSGYVVSFAGLTDYNAVELSHGGAGDFSLGAFGVVSAVSGRDIGLGFDFLASDADGDTSSGAIDFIVSPVAVAPIAIDLDGDGVEFLSLADGVAYDYGEGQVSTAWVHGDDGLLAHKTADGLDIVFTDDAEGATSDLDGLAKAYDSNGDGMFDASDAAFAEFGVWQDANSDGLLDHGEFVSLSDAGIVSISLTSDGLAYSAADGDVEVVGTTAVTFADGSTGAAADAAFSIEAVMDAMLSMGDDGEFGANTQDMPLVAETVADALSDGAMDAIVDSYSAPLGTDTDAHSGSADLSALLASGTGSGVNVALTISDYVTDDNVLAVVPHA